MTPLEVNYKCPLKHCLNVQDSDVLWVPLENTTFTPQIIQKDSGLYYPGRDETFELRRRGLDI